MRAIDLRYLERWKASRRTPALRQMGVDEIYLGNKQKFLSVVSNLETGEPLWFGRERKKESLDGFFQTELSARQRRGIEAACVDMWEPYRRSIEQWAPNCQIYDKFHIMQHANAAVDEVRRAEFFRKGGRMRGVVKGKRWLLLSRWGNLDSGKKRQLNTLFALNRRVLKAYLLKESLDRLWTYHYEGAMLALSTELAGSVAMAAVEAVRETGPDASRSPGGHSQLLPYQSIDGRGGSSEWQHQESAPSRPWLPEPALPVVETQRMAVTKTEFVAFRKAA